MKIQRISAFIALIFVSFSLLKGQCYELYWAEEFNYTGFPSEEFWTHQVDGNGGGNNELQYYKENDADNAWVENGILTITAIKENFGGREYTSARIDTDKKFEFQYGKAEARMRLPYGQGLWAAFWAMGDYDKLGWPRCGEIDIMEMIGGSGKDNTVHGTLHWYEGGHASYGLPYTLASGIFADEYHVFSMEWTPGAIRIFMDGTQYFVMDITGAGKSEYHAPFFILLNLAVGGNWPGSPDGSTVFPQKMEVDYVRVYKLGSEIEIEGEKEIAELTEHKFSLPYSETWTYEWTVPGDAEIISGQGTEEITVNWGCTNGEVNCTLTGDCGTYEVTHPLTVNTELEGPMFIDENETGVLFHLPEMANTSYTWTIPEDAAITMGDGTDSIFVDWGSIFTNVSVTLENSCGTNTLTFDVLKTGQYPFPDPYTPHSIPGTINATEYDYGGEGVAYHDNSSANEGDGIRQDQRVDTQNSDNGKPNVGWVLSGEWLDYTIDVEESGDYNVVLRTASANSSGGPAYLLVNGEERLGPIPVPGTGEWSNFINLQAGKIALDAADTLLTVKFVGGGFNLGDMKFTLAPASAAQSVSYPGLEVSPNPAWNQLQVRGNETVLEYQIVNIHGAVVQRGYAEDVSFVINIEDLSPGIYMITTIHDRGFNNTAKFVKSN